MFVLERINEVAEQLGDDEQEVLLRIAERFLSGRDQYGELDLDRDPRDFARETSEELCDALVYLASLEIRAERRRRA